MHTLFYCDHYGFPLTEGHKFPVRKYKLLREVLQADEQYLFSPAPLASPEEIALVHDGGYIAAFSDGSLTRAAVRRIGFPLVA